MSKPQGQLGDPNAADFYRNLIENKAARDAWNDMLVPKTDAKKLAFARRCLATVEQFDANRVREA